MPFYIRKSSGEKEEFSIKKFRRSLRRSGADAKTIEKIIARVKKEKPKSTKKLHELATQLLQKYQPPIADRYNLKRALMELGPAGYPFELFVAQLYAHQGYKVLSNQLVNGFCVDHEVDIIAEKGKQHVMIECKFHNRPGLKSDVKVSLYIQARFEDIRDAWERNPQHPHEFHQVWLVTNTRFTSEAIKYGECKNIKLVSWAYPENKGLAIMIDSLGLHPITTLTSLTKQQKRSFIKEGLILCKDAQKHITMLKRLGFSKRAIEKIVAESEAVCHL